jgi:hypothetical protein
MTFRKNLLPSFSEMDNRSSETHVNFQGTSIAFKDPNFRDLYREYVKSESMHVTYRLSSKLTLVTYFDN